VELYYSASRIDSFSSWNGCSGCDGYGYKDIEPQGSLLLAAPGNESTTLLSAYYSDTLADNVLGGPQPAGYRKYSDVGYVYDNGGVGRTAVRLWYKGDNHTEADHWTTFSPAEEAHAKARNYTVLALLGYALPPGPPSNTSLPSCYQRGGNVDLYFLGAGVQYIDALASMAAVSGSIPIPRRHWLGMSWSKWGNQLDQTVTLDQVASLRAAGFPVDTYIFDMQWHLKPGWTGYTWDPASYPDHVQLLAQLHDNGLATGVNLHDASGVQSFEKRYSDMARAMAIDPSTNATLAFNIDDQVEEEKDGGVCVRWGMMKEEGG
jgi:alpha-glucosidase (family GH31 glycosyl hydrolase)